MKSLPLLLLLPLALVAAPVRAEEEDSPRSIAGVAWHATLEAGRKAAAPATGKTKRKARPILYLRMLGDLAGKT